MTPDYRPRYTVTVALYQPTVVYRGPDRAQAVRSAEFWDGRVDTTFEEDLPPKRPLLLALWKLARLSEGYRR